MMHRKFLILVILSLALFAEASEKRKKHRNTHKRREDPPAEKPAEGAGATGKCATLPTDPNERQKYNHGRNECEIQNAGIVYITYINTSQKKEGEAGAEVAGEAAEKPAERKKKNKWKIQVIVYSP